MTSFSAIHALVSLGLLVVFAFLGCWFFIALFGLRKELLTAKTMLPNMIQHLQFRLERLEQLNTRYRTQRLTEEEIFAFLDRIRKNLAERYEA